MMLAARVLGREDLVQRIMIRYEVSEDLAGYEEFTSDIIAFQGRFPNLLSVFVCFGVDFEQALERLNRSTNSKCNY